MRSHVLIALLALVLLMGIAMQSELQKSGSLIQRIETADIAIEHTAPLSMQFRMSTRNDQAIAEFLPTGSGVALVSVPMNWQRSEVRGTPLKQLENEEPVFGYARWKIPSGTQITFSIMDAPQKVLLHNPTAHIQIPHSAKRCWRNVRGGMEPY